MKSTGIVRRIDDLGRVVIPKEIRKTMRLNEGTLIEFLTDSDHLILQKYSVLESIGSVALGILGTLYRIHKLPVIACDTDKVIAVKGISKEEVINRRITSDFEEILRRRNIYAYDVDDAPLFPVEGIEQVALACAPVIASGDVVGAILFLSEDDTPTHSATEIQISLVHSFAAYLGEQLSD